VVIQSRYTVVCPFRSLACSTSDLLEPNAEEPLIGFG